MALGRRPGLRRGAGNLTGDAGPVHVNVPLRDPLVATPERAGEPVWPDDLRGRADGKPWVRVPQA